MLLLRFRSLLLLMWGIGISCRSPAGCFLLCPFFYAVQLVRPVALKLAGPLVKWPYAVGVRPVELLASIAAHAHEAGVAQNTQVFRHGWLVDTKAVDDLID